MRITACASNLRTLTMFATSRQIHTPFSHRTLPCSHHWRKLPSNFFLLRMTVSPTLKPPQHLFQANRFHTYHCEHLILRHFRRSLTAVSEYSSSGGHLRLQYRKPSHALRPNRWIISTPCFSQYCLTSKLSTSEMVPSVRC